MRHVWTGRRLLFFFFNDTATTEIYTLSLHDALPISVALEVPLRLLTDVRAGSARCSSSTPCRRSEEHTSELQSQSNLVCRLLLEKKKNKSVEAGRLPDNYHGKRDTYVPRY